MQTAKWYEIRNASGDAPAEVFIYDMIGGWGVSAADFVRDWNKVKNSKAINVHINSPGGSVQDGIAIYNAIKASKAKVTCIVDGWACSIASVIALAGQELHMPESSMLMIHNPHAVCMGESSAMRDMADLLDKIRSQIVAIYSSVTKTAQDEIVKLMDAETWMTGKEAVDSGYASKLLDSYESTAEAKWDPAAAARELGFMNDATPYFNAVFACAPAPLAGDDGLSKPAVKITVNQETKTMEIKDLTELQKQYPELYAQACAQAVQEGRDAERKRIASILEAAHADQSILARKLIDDGTSELESLKAINNAAKQRDVAALEQLASVENKAVAKVTPIAPGAKPDGAPTRESALAKWEAMVRARMTTHGETYDSAEVALIPSNSDLYDIAYGGGAV